MSCLRGRFRDAVAVGLWCAVGCAAAAARPVRLDAWQEANAARGRFEARSAHTRAEYQGVMDGFRAIYHANPADAHAAAAVEQVAELLAEQGRELHDAKSLRDAAGQYEFLAKQYPASSLAAPALGAEVELFGPEGLGDAAEARRVAAELRKTYPRSAAVLGKSRGSESAAVVRRPRSERPDTAAGVGQAVGRPAKSPAGLSAASAKSADFGRDDKVVASPEAGLSAALRSGRDDKVIVSRGDKASKPMAWVTGIRHWSTASYTRVAIDLGDEVEYQATRVEHPDRIFFDLHHAHLAPELVGKSFAVTDDGFLTRIRAAQYSDDVTRVVLDVHEVTDYSAFLLPNPYRLIIDIHGKQSEAADSKRQAANSVPVGDRHYASSNDQHFASSSDAAPVVRQSGESEVSSLPPMPVTDGSAGFGLPPRATSDSSSRDVKTAAVAPPRVVIPVKPTAAKPVPNTVVSRTGNTGTEVAEVSDQPGKVEATRRPTSGPISSKGRDQGSGARGQKAVPVDLGTRVRGVAAPAVVAPPTADGETSLMRALGLKIGRIVIDAGHGGHDSGTIGADGIQEKDVVLDVALRLGKLLHQRMGAEIVYTRADDTFVPLETRTAIANKAQADLFISVHANSSPDASARGTEVYYLNFTSDPEAMRVAARENAVSTQSVHELSDLVKKIALKDKIDESKELATDVEASLYKGLEKGNDGLKDRGVKKAPFVVLIGANMPSILAEISFVSNPDDAEELLTPEYRERVAESLFNGVARYAAGINGVKTPVVRVAEKR